MLMKVQRMSKACVLISIFLLIFTWMSPISAQRSTNNQVDRLIRLASKECRTAKTKRRSDLRAAQDHFKRYQELLQEALELQPDLLDSPGQELQQKFDYCANVKRDLDRARAVPQFETGLRECADARIMVANAAFDDAEVKFQTYLEYRNSAVAISESVLDVYDPNSYEVRLCDRLGDDIAAAKAQYFEQLKAAAAAAATNLFEEVVAGLSQAERQCSGAQNLINATDSYSAQTVSQVENLSKQVESDRADALKERDKLVKQGKRLDRKTGNQINSLVSRVGECLAGLPAGVTRVKNALASRSKFGAGRKKPETINREARQIVGAPAEYPRRALNRNIEGSVTVSFTITKTGDVADIAVVNEEPKGYFEKAVRKAVNKWKFQPRIRNNLPVDTKNVSKTIYFKLQ